MRGVRVGLFASILSSLLVLLATPVVGGAQGMVIPRCVPSGPCGWNGPGVARISSDVKADLANRVVRYEATETFKNLGSGLGEADYLFPLPAGAAFQDLKLSIDGEMVAGETLNAQEARGIYEEIVRRRRDPALVEWMGYGLLRARIFPLAAGEEKRVVVRFQAVVPREGDAMRIDYLLGGPSTTGPTIGPIALIRPAMHWEGVERPADRWTFSLSYPKAEVSGTAYSPTHSITTDDDGDHRVVHATGAGRDLTILLPVARHDGASVAVLPYAPGNGDGFALITVTPPAVREVATPRDVTLVIDVSGSMGGRKIEQARAAGRQLLATLSPRDRFRMIDFSTDVHSFRDGFVFATPAHVREAEAYLDQLEAEGSTNLAGALTAALSSSSSGEAEPDESTDATRLKLVLFVTDGEPTIGERNPEAIVAHAVQDLHHTRLFTFGLGADVNTPLLEQLALQGHGTAQFVRPDESVERAVSLVAHRLTNPIVTDLTVTTDGVRLQHTSPEGPVDLFAGQDLVLLTRYHGNGHSELRFTGHSISGPVTWTSTADFPSRDRANAFVARLWATQRIGYLTAERHRAGGGESSEIDAEIKALGEEYGIPTEFTSYLVREPAAVAGQPTMAPAGVAGGMALRKEAFEQAKSAAAQRSVMSLAMADSMAGPALDAARAEVRRAGDRTLVLQDSVWVDTRYHAPMRIVRVAPYSAAYFAVLDAIPDLRGGFAAADRVRLAGWGVAIEVSPAGVATLDAGALSAIRADW